MQTSTRLWNKNFILLVTGQLMSIFGNQILTFALPLYILQTHDSAALFGTVLGLSFISLLIASPIGGIMADRLKKQYVMFWLDIITTAVIVLYMILSGIFVGAIVLLVIGKLLVLNAVQGFYMPVVQSAIPFIVPSDRLTQANSATSVVNTLSNIAAPAVAGLLLGIVGLWPILVIAVFCFAVTAVMDLLIDVPYKKQETSESVLQTAKSDMAQAIRFVTERPLLIKIGILMTIIAMLATGALMVGVPVFIIQTLGMGSHHMGIGRAISWGGALLGTAIVGYLGERLTIKTVPLIVIIMGISLVPIGVALILDVHHLVAFAMFIASDFMFTVVVLLYMIPLWVYIQRISPEELVGKVMALFSALPFAAGGIGYLVYGVLFERLYNLQWLTIFVTAFITCVTGIFFWKDFREFDL